LSEPTHSMEPPTRGEKVLYAHYRHSSQTIHQSDGYRHYEKPLVPQQAGRHQLPRPAYLND
jgi:hypothetical protein